MSVRAALYKALETARWYLKDRCVLEIRRLLEESQGWTSDRIQDLQNESLRALIRYVHEHVPYYRKVMEEKGLKPRDI